MKKIKVLYKCPGCVPVRLKIEAPGAGVMSNVKEIPICDGVSALVLDCGKDTMFPDPNRTAVILGKKRDKFVSIPRWAVKTLLRSGILGV